MQITSITIYKTDDGFRIRLEGRGIGRKLNAGVFAPSIKQAVVEVKKLLLHMVVQKMTSFGGQLMSEDEAAQLRKAQEQLTDRMQQDTVSRDKPVPRGEFGEVYERNLEYLRKRREGIAPTPGGDPLEAPPDDDRPPFLRVVKED